MSTIIDSLKIETAIQKNEYFNKMRDCGFKPPVEEFPIITQEAIKQYLITIIKKMFVENKRLFFSRLEIVELLCSRIQFSFGFFDKIREIVWLENNTSAVRCFPPEHVLHSIQKAKNKFDAIKIVTIETIIDPLVVGIRKGDDNRYLIDWWDKDIDLSEITML